MADDVSYSREGWPVLNGKEAVQDFFEHQRQLHGQHIVTDIHTTPAVLVNGRFVGTNAGQPISLNFQDLWTFQPDQRVAFRKSWISIPGV